jgi:Kef-type K+ transport system membrane component KefB/predicted amino acid-binding ACT domain protein
VLLDVAVILVAAKVAAELCERLKVPAVVGEIVAGLLIGPSVLGWLPADSEPVAALAELGVLLLLVQVGMEMDLTELGRVGRASMSVAIIGVAAPFLGGGLVGLGFGEGGNTTLFVGAALTATSVGITARVFGDLKALATTEARVVLGAAVADDVLGLIILTVVVKIVTGGDVSAVTIVGTIGAAVGFLVVATSVGVFALPVMFRHVERSTRSSATVVVVAFALMLVFAWAAEWAKLAPIIGAFVAGLAIGRSDQHARVEREFGSIANLLIPVFFVQIGLDADVASVARPAVLGLAGALVIVAIAGKLASAAGAIGLRVDKAVVGIGMIPRGEVGIIFASIGLANGVIGDDQYAALLIVVLVTTLMTPPLLRWRLASLQTGRAGLDDDVDDEWEVAVVGDRIVLRGQPSSTFTVPLALQVAGLAPHATPDSTVIRWFGDRTSVPLDWKPVHTAGLIDVLRDGDARSLRFLDVTGVLERALPEVGEALARRRSDPGELDPTRVLQLPTLQRVAGHADRTTLLSALVADVCATGSPSCAADLAARLDPGGADDITAAVRGSALFHGALTDPDPLREPSVLQLAEHLGNKPTVDAAYQLAAAGLASDDWRVAELAEIRDRVLDALSHPELLDGTSTLVGTRRREAIAALGPASEQARRRLEAASPSFLVSHEPGELARQATLLGVLPRRGVVRVVVEDGSATGTWRVDVSCRDRPGLLARLTDSLAESQLDVVSASLATWPDGGVLDSFLVRGAARPDAGLLTELMERRLSGKISLPPLRGLTVTFDDDVFPWHTLCSVRGPDRPGLLAAIAGALDAAKVDVHAATVTSYSAAAGQCDDPADDDSALIHNRFQVTDRHGGKLTEATRRAVLTAFDSFP